MHLQNTLVRRLGLSYFSKRLTNSPFSKKCNCNIRTIGSSESMHWKKTIKRFGRVIVNVSNAEFHAETNDPNILQDADKLQVFASNGMNLPVIIFCVGKLTCLSLVHCTSSQLSVSSLLAYGK